jgi:hypothetical protein
VLSFAAAELPNQNAMMPIIMTDNAITEIEIRAAALGVRAANASQLVRRFPVPLLIFVLVVPVGLVAIGSGLGLIALPEEMFGLANRAPLLFPTHMVCSALALLMAPVVLAARRHPEFHRPLGRLLGAFVVIGGLTALPVAVMSHSPLGARAGFFVQGLVWLSLLLAGIRSIRRHDVDLHARLMLAMVAVTTGAVWFRILTGAAILLELPFDEVYTGAAWAGWMAPLAIVAARQRAWLAR